MKNNLPLIKEMPAAVTPRDLARVFPRDKPFFVLESALRHDSFGRYSLAGFDPFRTAGGGEDPFAAVNDLVKQCSVSVDSAIPWPAGGAFGYWGYELKNLVEQLPQSAENDTGVPAGFIGLYDCLAVFDHAEDTIILVSTGLPETDPEKADERALSRMAEMEQMMSSAAERPAKPAADPPRQTVAVSNFTHDEYTAAVRRIKEYIAAGDIYQANLSQRFTVKTKEDALTVYDRLCRNNPAPFAAYLHCVDFQVVSASPERFLKMEGDCVETRPIKGTRPRGKDKTEDVRLSEELQASAKDRAELLMIVDLERNDLGRVCRYGSVHVPDLFGLESYATVHHLVATVRGNLREGATHTVCLRACFPGGSITGAPKIRAMEIIDELEPHARNVYTGAIGYLGFNRRSDLNIAIRTMVMKDGKAYVQAGGGIVADSDPEEEYEETLVKARALLMALGVKEENL